MIVFDLKCGGGHVFEAWFGSSGDYDTQRDGGLISCPICNDCDVEKAVMAPAVAAKSNRRQTPASMAAGDPQAVKAALKTLAEMQRAMIAKSEYVGDRFAEEVRSIHYGETAGRGIYGETTPAEAAALRDEGIDAFPLLFPLPGRGDA